MRNYIILLTVIVTFTSCSVKEKPEFLKVENIKVTETTASHITVTANALFKNPNAIGGQLQTDALKVFINNDEVATVSTELFKVPAKDNFSIPLTAKIDTKRLISDNSLSGLLGSLLSQKIEVQYKGDIKYKVIGFSHNYHIDKTETIKIKL